MRAPRHKRPACNMCMHMCAGHYGDHYPPRYALRESTLSHNNISETLLQAPPWPVTRISRDSYLTRNLSLVARRSYRVA